MKLILQLETSTTNCSVSLSSEGETLVFKEDYGARYSHAERLHVYIDDVMNEAGLPLNALQAVAISKGPGSYTGLRIGISAAKGLCYALDIPLISIPTLESLASQVRKDSGFIIPMIDARRMEAYTCIFTSEIEKVRDTRAEILDQDSYADYLEKGDVHFIGNAVEKASEVISHHNANFIKDKLPSAKDMSRLAWRKYKAKEFEDIAYFEPFYLKDFIVSKPKS
ncbi:MAG: tRNA (adenosine(37)-N6)-threonylcarbamoyltransferase complex dimerization subunit type 1 TsaB [Bacteroidia bacterium]|nr:tRNA (adenosine(37)-N6)-threonylcarbamoyltransferase complex dimerization subunit type 1 TsaB [Bacteroidia bacterium]